MRLRASHVGSVALFSLLTVLGAIQLRGQAPMTADELKGILSDAARTSRTIDSITRRILVDVNPRSEKLISDFAQHNAETCEYPQGHPELCANYDRERSDLALRSADLQKELKAAETPRAAARVHFEQLMTRLRTASWPESLTGEKDRLIGCTSLNGSKDAEACLVAAQKKGPRPPA